MGIDLITGEANSGKTGFMLSEIARMKGKRHIILSPDQYSYRQESRLCRKLGGSGLNGVEVLTMSQMARRFLKPVKTALTPAGKRMLLYRAARESLLGTVYENACEKPGFLDKAAALLTELERYSVSTEDLSGDYADKSLNEKTAAISALYSRYAELSRDFYDSGRDLERVAEYIEGSGDEFAGVHIWIDEFSDFLPCHYRVIRAFLDKAAAVHLCLCMDPKIADPSYLFPVRTYERFMELGKEYGISVRSVELFDRRAPELMHLQQEYSSARPYEGQCSAIEVFRSRDMYSEVQHAAVAVADLVREEGLAYGDISVIIPDDELYKSVVGAVFSSYKIPYFSDEKIPVSQHPAARLVLSFFDIAANNWRYDDVFAYLRTGFIFKKENGALAALSQSGCDVLENYVLKHGIRGRKHWLSEEDWTEDGQTASCDALRREIVRPIAGFLSKKKGTVEKTARAFFEFLEEICLREGLEAESVRLEKEGRLNESARLRRVWNILISALDQLTLTCGEEKCSVGEFASYLSSGLSQCEIGIIPPGLDRVSVASVSRNSAGGCGALIIMGASFGVIPPAPPAEGLITDRERDILHQNGIDLAPKSTDRIIEGEYRVFRLLCAPRERLLISCPTADNEGKTVELAPFVKKIAQMFPRLRIRDNLSGKEELFLSSPEATLSAAVTAGKNNPLWRTVYEWFLKNPQYSDRLRIIEEAERLKRRVPAISPGAAERLYGREIVHSASRLEEFSKCPFRYFVSKGLKASEREIYSWKPADLGNMMHNMLLSYCTAVEGDAKDEEKLARWRTLSDEENDELIERIVAAECANVSDKSRLRIMLRAKRALAETSKVIRASLSAGDYFSAGHEIDFETELEGVKLYGKIDRLDMRREGAEVYIRIIDYKSGAKHYDPETVYDAADLQLVLYAVAAAGLIGAEVGGIFYEHVVPPRISADSTEQAQSELAKYQMLDGRIFSDGYDEVSHMDSGVEETGASSFLKVRLKRDGTLYQNSCVDPKHNFDLLSRHVRRTVAGINEKIHQGVIDTLPFKSKKLNSCDFCPYGEVCLFDREKGRKRLSAGAGDGIWQLMETE